eukprot:s2307_g3.t1
MRNRLSSSRSFGGYCTIAAPKEESNADYMVSAQHYINWLHENVGKPTPSGRTFALDEVTEAELRVLQFFEEGGGDQAASSSSDSESSSLKPRRGRPPLGALRRCSPTGGFYREVSPSATPVELKKSKSKKDPEIGGKVQHPTVGSDSEELSGEESVDEADGYPVQHWEELTPEVLPGLEGFNRRATAVMIKAQVGQGQLQVTFDEKAACPPLQPHQEAVSFLMHPKSPISRLLVDHPTGSGKTREMIKAPLQRALVTGEDGRGGGDGTSTRLAMRFCSGHHVAVGLEWFLKIQKDVQRCPKTYNEDSNLPKELSRR